MLKIEYVPITSIKPYEKNAKLHPQEQIEQIKNSIKSFGFNDPLALWHNEIVEGHGRYLAAKELGFTELPVIKLDGLTDEQRRAYMLAHNKLTMNSGFDIELLNEELADIFEFDMGDFGFEIGSNDDDKKEATDDDYTAEPPKEPKSKYGDIYILGNHRLMCGDSTKKEDIDKLLDGVKVDLLLTDPPYGVDIVQKNGEIGSGKLAKCNKYEAIIGDDTTDTAKNSYKICKELSKNQIIFGGNYFTDFLSPSMCWLVWDKENGDNHFADVELAWTSFNKAARIYHYLWNGMCREGSKKLEGVKRVHPTQKPAGLMGNILNDFTKENDTVLDVFGGSGSTLIACEQLNRKCYIMELSPAYVDVIIDRWEKFTSQKAIKL